MFQQLGEAAGMSKKQYLRNRLCDIHTSESFKALTYRERFIFDDIYIRLRTKPCKIVIQKQIFTVEKGTFIVTLRTMSDRISINKTAIERSLKKFDKLGLFHVEKLIKFNKVYGHVVYKSGTPIGKKVGHQNSVTNKQARTHSQAQDLQKDGLLVFPKLASETVKHRKVGH